MNDLLKKLKSLGLEIKPASQVPQNLNQTARLDDVISGEWIHGLDGEIFKISKLIPYGQPFGKYLINDNFDFYSSNQLFNNNSDFWNNLSNFVFLDTETSSLNTGAGTFVFLVGLCYFTEKSLTVEQLFLSDLSNEVFFLSYLDECLKSFSIVFTYNGKAFDFPILQNRYVINKIPNCLLKLIHIDLLHYSRSIWKLRLDSRRLADIEKEILGVSRGNEEIPGWMVPQVYFDFLAVGDASPLKGVFYHNEMDIISLAMLFQVICRYVSSPAEDFTHKSLDLISIGEIFQRKKNLNLAEIFYKSGFDLGLPDEITAKMLYKYGMVLKRQGKWTEAVELWISAAEKQDFLSTVELAKYYEHKVYDYNQALSWTKHAIQILNDNKIESLLEMRLNRLIVKMNKKNEG